MARVRPSSLWPERGAAGEDGGADVELDSLAGLTVGVEEEEEEEGTAMSSSLTVGLVVLVAMMWPRRTDLRFGAPL